MDGRDLSSFIDLLQKFVDENSGETLIFQATPINYGDACELSIWGTRLEIQKEVDARLEIYSAGQKTLSDTNQKRKRTLYENLKKEFDPKG